MAPTPAPLVVLDTETTGLDVERHRIWEVAALRLEWARDRYAVVVPSFDATMLGALITREGMVPAWHHQLIDAEAVAAGHLHWSGREGAGMPPWDGDEQAEALRIAPVSEEQRHTALGDALAAMRLLMAALDLPAVELPPELAPTFPHCTCGSDASAEEPHDHEPPCPLAPLPVPADLDPDDRPF